MILGPISLLDCLAFVIVLIPQLLYQADLFSLLLVIVKVIPFLGKQGSVMVQNASVLTNNTVVQLPYQTVRERYYTKKGKRSPFTRNATLFQDLVIRCVRYAFANIPASIGRVFFSKWVAYPFFRFRLLRHGYLHCPMYYREIIRHGAKGLWMIDDPNSEPDIVIYYAHGKLRVLPA